MVKKELEIRGISRKYLSTYLLQLGAVKDPTNSCLYKGNTWSCKLSDEENFHMFQSIIPKVFVFFEADDAETLAEIITQFRKKTFRAGG